VAWLRASPIHVEEYLGVAVMANELPAVLAATGDPEDVLVEQARAAAAEPVSILVQPREADSPGEYRFGRRFWPLNAGPALVTTLGVLLLACLAVFQWGRDGPDRTTLHLNGDSSVTVRYASAERRVTLNRGEALFEVAHEPSRRFHVTAGDTGAIALGTQFDLRRSSDDAALVTVIEGAVGVYSGHLAGAHSELGMPPGLVVAHGGEQVLVRPGQVPGQPVAVNVADVTGWLHRKISFNQLPLGDVVKEFNRYAAVPLVVDDPGLNELPISGVFNAYDTNSFIAFLRNLDGVLISRTESAIHVSGKRKVAAGHADSGS
jgi:transmembrane sensor